MALNANDRQGKRRRSLRVVRSAAYLSNLLNLQDQKDTDLAQTL